MANGKWEIRKGRGLQHFLRHPFPKFYFKKRDSWAFVPALYLASSLPYPVRHPLHEFGTAFLGFFLSMSRFRLGWIISKSWACTSSAPAGDTVFITSHKEHQPVPTSLGHSNVWITFEKSTIIPKDREVVFSWPA
jgi:hypothetical protein